MMQTVITQARAFRNMIQEPWQRALVTGVAMSAAAYAFDPVVNLLLNLLSDSSSTGRDISKRPFRAALIGGAVGLYVFYKWPDISLAELKTKGQELFKQMQDAWNAPVNSPAPPESVATS